MLRELRATASGIFGVLLTILVSLTLIRVLGRAATGRVDPELVVPLIVFNTLNLVSAVVMLTTYVSLLIVLTRWSKDSENIIWLCSGKSMMGYFKPLMHFVAPMMVFTAIFSILVVPWSRDQLATFEDLVKQKQDVDKIVPGSFRESASGRRVFFLENPDRDDGRIGMVFVRGLTDSGSQIILLSRSGTFEIDDLGQRWIVLERGFRTDFTFHQLSAQTMGFDFYRIRLDSRTFFDETQKKLRTLSTLELLGSSKPTALSELSIRLGLPFLTLALGFLALPLSFYSRRSGRSAGLILALLFYAITSNLFSISQTAISAGKLSFWVACLVIPGAVISFAFLLTFWKSHLFPTFSDLFWKLLSKFRAVAKYTKVNNGP